MTYKMLQWNCSGNKEYNKDYLLQRLKDVDIVLFQRCPNSFLEILKDKFQNVFHKNHSKETSLVFANNFDFRKHYSIEQNFYELPTVNLANKSNDSAQGSHALSITFDNLQIIVFLSAYSNKYDSVEITNQDTYNDINYVFKNIVTNQNCIIAGDVHCPPNQNNEIETLISNYNFKNNTNNLITFALKKHNDLYAFNLDRVLTRGNVNVSKLESYARPQDGGGHWAFTYTMEINQ